MKYTNKNVIRFLSVSLLASWALVGSTLSARVNSASSVELEAAPQADELSEFTLLEKTETQLETLWSEWEELKAEGFSPNVVQGMIFGLDYMYATESEITRKLAHESLPSQLQGLSSLMGSAYTSQAVQNLSGLISAVSFFGRPVAQDVIATIATGMGSEPLLNAVSQAALRMYPANGSLSNWFARKNIVGGVYNNLSWIFNTATFYGITSAEYLASQVYAYGEGMLRHKHLKTLPEGSALNSAWMREQAQTQAQPISEEGRSKATAFVGKLHEARTLDPEGYVQFTQAIIFGKENAQKSIEENMTNLEAQLQALGLKQDSTSYTAVMNMVCLAAVVAQPLIQEEVAFLIGGVAGPTVLHLLNMGAQMAQAGLGKSWMGYLAVSYLEGSCVKASVDIVRYVAFYLVNAVRSQVPGLITCAYELAAAYFPVAYQAGKGWCSWAYNYAYESVWGGSQQPQPAAVVPTQPAPVAAPSSSSYASTLYSWGAWVLGY